MVARLVDAVRYNDWFFLFAIFLIVLEWSYPKLARRYYRWKSAVNAKHH